MAVRRNPAISARIDKQSRAVLAFLCQIDECNTSAFVAHAVTSAVTARLAQLADARKESSGVLVPDEERVLGRDALI